MTDTDLYRRGAATLLASWEAYARGASGAVVRRCPGVAAAVFPNEPERGVYNNALLQRDMAASERADALEAMEAAYTAAGVTRFAAWAHESDVAMRADLERRGYTLDTSTRAMGMVLDELRLPRPEIELGPPDWLEYLRILGVPPDFLAQADPAEYRVLVARLDGGNVATAMAFDLDGDCGIYNVGTLEHARRRGLGTALTALHLHDARGRGCRTASLQSTPMAERMYATVGFRDLGRIHEYVPGEAGQAGAAVASSVRARASSDFTAATVASSDAAIST
jgi:ribosomal protein S18 acetylase RimI-like enzyme